MSFVAASQGLFILSSFPRKRESSSTAAYGNFPVAKLYGFPPARERREPCNPDGNHVTQTGK